MTHRTLFLLTALAAFSPAFASASHGWTYTFDGVLIAGTPAVYHVHVFGAMLQQGDEVTLTVEFDDTAAVVALGWFPHDDRGLPCERQSTGFGSPQTLTFVAPIDGAYTFQVQGRVTAQTAYHFAADVPADVTAVHGPSEWPKMFQVSPLSALC